MLVTQVHKLQRGRRLLTAGEWVSGLLPTRPQTCLIVLGADVTSAANGAAAPTLFRNADTYEISWQHSLRSETEMWRLRKAFGISNLVWQVVCVYQSWRVIPVQNVYGCSFVCTKLLRDFESWITSSFDDEDIYNSVMTSWMGRQDSKNGEKQPLASLEFEPLRPFPFPASNEV